MNKSECVTELSAALSKAQAGIANAAKEGMNPHFKKSYATLKSVWDVCKKPLTDNGLSVVQSPEVDGSAVKVTTTLLHKSGQWFESSITMPVPAKSLNCQGIGSAITYARRYALAAMVGVAPEDDDDGEGAVNRDEKNTRQQPSQQQKTETNQPQQTEQKQEPSDYQKLGRFIKATGCKTNVDVNLVLDLVAPGQTLESIKSKDVATFVFVELMKKLKAGVFTAETALQVARSSGDACELFNQQENT